MVVVRHPDHHGVEGFAGFIEHFAEILEAFRVFPVGIVLVGFVIAPFGGVHVTVGRDNIAGRLDHTGVAAADAAHPYHADLEFIAFVLGMQNGRESKGAGGEAGSTGIFQKGTAGVHRIGWYGNAG